MRTLVKIIGGIGLPLGIIFLGQLANNDLLKFLTGVVAGITFIAFLGPPIFEVIANFFEWLHD